MRMFVVKILVRNCRILSLMLVVSWGLYGCKESSSNQPYTDAEIEQGYRVVSERQRLVELSPSPEFCDHGRFGIYYCYQLLDRLSGEHVRVYGIEGFQGIVGQKQLMSYREQNVEYIYELADAPWVIRKHPKIIKTTAPSEASTYQLTLQRWLLKGTFNHLEELSFPLVLTGYERQSMVCELDVNVCQQILQELQAEDVKGLLVEVSVNGDTLSIEQLLCSSILDEYEQVCLDTP